MSFIENMVSLWNFNRERSLSLLEAISENANSEEILAWRPAESRAHIAWQLMHIGVTEELFATSRLIGDEPHFAALVERFRGGSVPDDDIPGIETIRETLEHARNHLLETIGKLSDDDLETIPEPFQDRGWSFGKILKVIAWHEPHHQGQAHAVFNLWKAQNETPDS